MFGFGVVGDGYPNPLFLPLFTGLCRGRFISTSRLLPNDCRLYLSYAQPFSQWVPALFTRVKRQRLEVYHSPPTAEVKIEWNSALLHLYTFVLWTGASPWFSWLALQTLFSAPVTVRVVSCVIAHASGY